FVASRAVYAKEDTLAAVGVAGLPFENLPPFFERSLRLRASRTSRCASKFPHEFFPSGEGEVKCLENAQRFLGGRGVTESGGCQQAERNGHFVIRDNTAQKRLGGRMGLEN